MKKKVKFPSMVGFSLTAADSGEKVKIAILLNCNDKYHQVTRLLLTQSTLDDIVYPEVLQRAMNGRLPPDSNKAIFVMLCILVTALTVEISLVKTYNLTSSAPLSVFIIMTAAYVVVQYYILEFVGRKLEVIGVRRGFQITLFKVVKLLQYLLSRILIALILQMMMTSYYYSVLL
jgi:hypothetical protein